MWKQICLIAGFLLMGALCAACQRKQAIFLTEQEISSEEEIGIAGTDGLSVEDTEWTGISATENVVDVAEEAYVAVYVCGAVNEPAVYYLNKGALKQDALDAAGGFAEGAATAYVNLAEQVTEGEKIYFPYAEELTESLLLTEGSGKDAEIDGKINLNTATIGELMTLPGIGESKAAAIIQYREEHGAFKSPEDIKKISGIKDGVYDKIKDFIVAN